MLGQQPQARLVLGVVVEVRVGDDGLGQAVALQQRSEGVPEAAAGSSVRKNSATISASLLGRSRRILSTSRQRPSGLSLPSCQHDPCTLADLAVLSSSPRRMPTETIPDIRRAGDGIAGKIPASALVARQNGLDASCGLW
jgi:hypothetical protein